MIKQLQALAKKLFFLTLLVPIVLLSCQNAKANEANAESVNIRDNDIVRGNTQAKVVIVEYLDVQCPACAYWHSILERTWRLIENDVTLVVRHFPLTNIHPHALKAAEYMEAAREQGGDAYYTFYKKMIENQDQWSKKNVEDATGIFKNYAQESGLNWEQILTDSEKRSVIKKVESDIKLGNQDGVTGTPTVLINNQKISIPQNANALYDLVQETIKRSEKP